MTADTKSVTKTKGKKDKGHEAPELMKVNRREF